MKTVRTTQSVCPVCIGKIDGKVIESKNKLYMVKNCVKHGGFKVLLSKYPSYHKRLYDFYFGLTQGSNNKVRNYRLVLTLKCNLNCPMCYMYAHNKYKEPSIEFIKQKIDGFSNYNIGLFGGEPTMRSDLPQVIEIIRESGNIPSLYTNGIKISDYDYLKKLRDSGLKRVVIQFDTFCNEQEKVLREKSFLDRKIKALENLKKLNMDVTFSFTLVKGVNEKQVKEILEFAKKNNMLKSILFMTYNDVENSNLKRIPGFDPWGMVDLTERQCNLKLKEKVFEFQKAFYILNYLIGSNICPNLLHFIFLRDNGELKPITNYFSFNKIKKIKKNKLLKNKHLIKLYLSIALLKTVNFRSLGILSKTGVILIKSLISRRLDPGLSDDFLVICFGGTCDYNNFDFEIAKYCIQGEITTNLGVMNSGAIAKILREKNRRLS